MCDSNTDIAVKMTGRQEDQQCTHKSHTEISHAIRISHQLGAVQSKTGRVA